MKRIIFMLAVLLALISLGGVAASDNATDVVAEDSADALSQEVIDDVPEEVLAQDDGQNDTLTVDEGNGDSLSQENAEVLQADKASSKITASNVDGYQSFESKVSFKLTSNNKALANKPVTIKINGVYYNKVTDSNGVASVSVNLKKGTYTAKCKFNGDNSTDEAIGTCNLYVKSPIATKLTVGDKNINYRQGSKCLFYVKLSDSKGKGIKKKWIGFKVDGKKYSAKTDKNGYAKIFLSLKKGKHKVKYYFNKKSPYLASKGSYKIKVKAKMPKGNGYWIWPAHMKSVNLASLASKGTKHLFLHVEALGSYGKGAVESFIRNAHRNGIKVHLWMQVAYDGGNWVSLVDDNGKLKYGFMNRKVAEAKYYAKIDGVDGVHFDYMRYGGTAHKHPNAVKSVNYFVKKASIKIHKVRPNCIVSVALMPEPDMMHYYYGQDVPTLSKYCDCLLPMAYKGSYGQPRSWIKTVTKTFVKQSNGAQIWTGLQTYHSEEDTSQLSHDVLLKDAKKAMAGGAKGVVLFRIGISCNFNFNKV
ncbi:hypothetical protein [Methanobrevibacter sp.]